MRRRRRRRRGCLAAVGWKERRRDAWKCRAMNGLVGYCCHVAGEQWRRLNFGGGCARKAGTRLTAITLVGSTCILLSCHPTNFYGSD
ncbi:hypothetical protein SLA2020_457720 [Shorea laevis]